MCPHVGFAILNFLHKFGFKTELEKRVDILSEIVSSELARRKEQKYTRNDFLQMMMSVEVPEGTEVERHGLTHEEMMAQCLFFLAAGYETTSSALTFFCLSMAQNEDCQDKLRQEIAEFCKQGKEINGETISPQSMPYLDMCLLESLRMYPPIFRTDRVCTAEGGTNLCGIEIPQGLSVSIPIAHMHRQAEFWPEPEKFNPHRFENGIPAESVFAFLPFGAGHHNCIGDRLAMLELRIAILLIFKKYKVKLSEHLKVNFFDPLKRCFS